MKKANAKSNNKMRVKKWQKRKFKIKMSRYDNLKNVLTMNKKIARLGKI